MDNRTIEEVRNNETKLIKEIEILEEENQKLKKQLSNDHQIKMKQLQQENRKLKQQISNSHQMENQQLREQINMYLNNEYKLKDRLEKQRKEYQETYKDVRIEIKELKEKLKASEKARKEAIELVKNNQRKDEFVELNEWQARDLISILDIDKGEQI